MNIAYNTETQHLENEAGQQVTLRDRGANMLVGWMLLNGRYDCQVADVLRDYAGYLSKSHEQGLLVYSPANPAYSSEDTAVTVEPEALDCGIGTMNVAN